MVVVFLGPFGARKTTTPESALAGVGRRVPWNAAAAAGRMPPRTKLKEESVSELEEKAAEYARQLNKRAAKEAKTKRTAAQEKARKRDQAKEFFAFARRHGAPALPRYISRHAGYEGRLECYERTNKVYVVACEWDGPLKQFSSTGWAVSANGKVHHSVSGAIVEQGYTPEQLGIFDRWFVVTSYSGSGPKYINTDFFYDEHLPAAAAALLEPARMAKGVRTGVQDNGWIGYRSL
ncbi:hypothetical protein KIK06_28985 [Nocardiopsis sp. EMB25]|uniref:hypothetical protein n=1 Tax=Nocardiopsis sp. EMB25 TaxID=2835867 RepID=UPI002284DC2C|nr:hypothetical protein [Nocardiopsis sp. EMB25]MCY9787919.1 hypothetical protein [Nocardiopsis sp. EMB25]